MTEVNLHSKAMLESQRRTDISDFAKESDFKLKICCENQRQLQRQKANAVVKKNKALDTFFYSVLKRMLHMQPQWLKLSNCTDECTSAEFQQFTNIKQILGSKQANT